MNFGAVSSETEQSWTTHLWFKQIKDQINKNYLCNIFNESVKLDIQDIEKVKFDGISEDQINILSKYSVDLLSSCLYKDNQYIYFDNKALKELKDIYQSFYIELVKNQDRQKTIKSHHDNIRDFLISTNHFLKIINSNDEERVKTFLCSEYSSCFQLNLFNIKIQDIIGPVLDVGCGENANLVHFLNNHGLPAIGIDRKTARGPYTIECDWFNFDFEEKKYGFVFSNNAFSLHFLNALKINQNIPMYIRLFSRILCSLQESGYFCYAPSIPFIEKYINLEEYNVSNLNVHDNFYMTRILRNKRVKT